MLDRRVPLNACNEHPYGCPEGSHRKDYRTLGARLQQAQETIQLRDEAVARLKREMEMLKGELAEAIQWAKEAGALLEEIDHYPGPGTPMGWTAKLHSLQKRARR